MALPPKFKPMQPGQKSFSASGYNDLQSAVADYLRLHFDSRFFTRQGNLVSMKVIPDLLQFYATRAGGLDVNVTGGKVWNWDATNIRPVLDLVEDDTLTLSASSTNYVYLKCTTTPNAIASYFVCWVNSAYSLVSATSEQANTVDFSDAVSGAGFSYVKIAEITTDGSGVTDITPFINDTIDHKWPWTLDLATFVCPT